jgi:hypothetical protein
LKQSRARTWSLVLLFAGAAMLLGVVAYIIGVRLGQPAEQVSTFGEPASSGQAVIPLPEIQRVGLKDAKAAYDIGNAIFLDVRDTDSYAASHIPGSINIPEGDMSTRLQELNSDQWIITVCT